MRNSGLCYFRFNLAFLEKKSNLPNGFLWSTHLINKTRHTKKNSNKGRQQNKIVTKGFKIFWLIWPIGIVAWKDLLILRKDHGTIMDHKLWYDHELCDRCSGVLMTQPSWFFLDDHLSYWTSQFEPYDYDLAKYLLD